MRSQRVRHNLVTEQQWNIWVSFCPCFIVGGGEIGRNKRGIGEGNGTPLQYSCLENPMDGGA